MLSKEFLTERGYCCGHGCLMCPYEPKHTKGNTKLMSDSYGSAKELGKKTLIGFVGAPWTLLIYMINLNTAFILTNQW